MATEWGDNIWSDRTASLDNLQCKLDFYWLVLLNFNFYVWYGVSIIKERKSLLVCLELP